MARRPTTGVAGFGLCLAIAACGSSRSAGSGDAAGTPLSYFPSNTPVVATIDTGANGSSSQSLKTLQSQEPDLAIARAALFAELAKVGVNYNQDLKPLLGTPIAVGVGASTVEGNATPFLLAWQTGSQSALQHLVADLHGLTKTGSHDGATLYTFDHIAAAVDGPLLLISQNANNLTAALDRHAAGNGFTSATYAADTAGLPSGAALSVVGDLQSVLEAPSAAQARKVPWVGAISGYGVTLTSTAKHLALQFRLRTDAHTLSAGQLPIAPGAAAPTLATGNPISFGLRDPAQVWQFFKSADQAVDPDGYAKLQTEEQSASTRTGVNLESFIDSLSGDVELSSTGHVTVGRISATAADAADWKKLLAHPGSGSTSTALGNGFYRVIETDGTTLVGGAVGDELLLGNGTPAQERTYAGAHSTPSGGTGAVAFQVAVGQLVKQALSGSADASNPVLGQLGSLLGDLTGSIEVTPQALTGSADLTLNPIGVVIAKRSAVRGPSGPAVV